MSSESIREPVRLEMVDESGGRIKIKCRACGQRVEIDDGLAGEQTTCPNCGKPMQIARHVFSINPFRRPIRKFWDDLGGIQWAFPFFPQVIESAVILLVLVIMAGLYVTVGLVSQISGIFEDLMHDAVRQIKLGTFIEKSAYAVAGGVYFAFWLPLWLVLLPFSVLGWVWKYLRLVGVVLMVLLAGLAVWIYFHPGLIGIAGMGR